MPHRARTLVALLALFALSGFLTESAWAMMCAPHAEVSGHVAGEHHAPAPGHSERAPSDAHPCPMTVASGGCVVAALPATAAVTEPVLVQDNLVLPSFDRTPDLLVVAGHFRPPRA